MRLKRHAVKNLWGVVTGLAILGVGSVAEADYLITLRDGKKIMVNRYREEGGQIQYRRFGVELGMPTAQVAVIEDRETGEKRVFNPFYTPQQLETIGERERDVKGLAGSDPGIEVLHAKLSSRYDRFVGEVRNNSAHPWRGAEILVRVFRVSDGAFAGHFRVQVTPNVIPPGGTGTFDASVPRDLGAVASEGRMAYVFLGDAK